ncbi:RNA dependent RNA polymerase-domain-containing protein [Halteromyces radiatus]|uniref:RNA dependent RNA polymerase-domain-containing protein n=1 Tax=Halteromyces radiatus TaxID=101107 RepID=UPI002220300B|nr:RNA dependent RNA polymerase-domain-containing protein [Halteromyces radiatus]KAI8092751.1 RNA dependent RNA polymerase-domain-containing protein [Halteromyces radiatus]
MTNNFKLNPKIVQHAKQIYIHLGLSEKQRSLTDTNKLHDLPIEIQKMHLLFSTDMPELTRVVHQFLQWSQHAKQKGTLTDFISQLDKALADLCENLVDWDDDDLCIDTDVNDVTTMDNSNNTSNNTSNTSNWTAVKRPFEEVNPSSDSVKQCKQKLHGDEFSVVNINTDLGSNSHSHSIATSSPTTSTQSTPFNTPTTPKNDPDHFAQKFQKQIQQEKESFPGYNIISSPIRSSGILNKAPWLFQFELARFMSHCQIPWNDLNLETTQHFIDVSQKTPSQLHDTMMNWFSEIRSSSTDALRLNLDQNLWKLISLERVGESVWIFDKQLDTNDDDDDDDRDVGNEIDVTTSNINSTTTNKIKSTNRCIRYTAKVHLPESIIEKPTLQLQPPRLQPSNRFFRKYGYERFLELRLSKFRSRDSLRLQSTFFLQPFLLMGRTYRFLFLKDDRMVMFATEGPGLTSITVREVIDWHIPIIDNWGLTTCKFASRMTLAYSNSIPTLSFDPSQVRFIDDIYADNKIKDDETCMTDGCGLISPSAMRKIMGSQQHDILPCAVQGRIAGAKGIWIVPPNLDMNSGDWIEIRASQNKFKTGLPGVDLKTDPLHFTFDLVKNAFCVYPSYLNTQFIQCLSAGGVPSSVFVDILQEHISNLTNILTNNRNLRLLRDWVVRTGGLMYIRRELDGSGYGLWQRQKQSTVLEDDLDGDDNNDVDTTAPPSPSSSSSSSTFTSTPSSALKFNRYSGLPSNIYEIIVRLLDAGFDLTNAFLANKVTTILRALMQNMATKYRVEVQQSCTLMCVPDPTGTLKPNEVFLQLSNRKIDETTGVHAGLIVGDILVTRNPCGLKSDVQKVTAVDSSALRVYSDVVVFSVQGDRSLASKLGGGDYDGDLIFCCWDQRLVEPFNACPVPDTSERVKVAFEKNTSKIRDELRHIRDLDEQGAKLQQLFLSVPVYDGTLGVYENWRTVLSELDSFDTPDAIYLAQMCALLVDSPKQGLTIKSWVRKEDYIKYSPYPSPAWFLDKLKKLKTTDDNRSINLVDRPPTTTMDHLHITISKEIEKMVQYTYSIIPEELVTRKDPDLIAPWEKALETAIKLDDKIMQTDLETIRQTVDDSFNRYQKDVKSVVTFLEQRSQRSSHQKQQEIPSSPSTALGDHLNKFNCLSDVEEYHAQQFQAAISLTSPVFQMDLLANDGRLVQTLKASCAYLRSIQHSKYSKYCYVVAYDILTRIKADAIAKQTKLNGLAVSVIPSTYTALTLEKRWIRKEKELQQQGTSS